MDPAGFFGQKRRGKRLDCHHFTLKTTLLSELKTTVLILLVQSARQWSLSKRLCTDPAAAGNDGESLVQIKRKHRIPYY